jgi:hypothetical protein
MRTSVMIKPRRTARARRLTGLALLAAIFSSEAAVPSARAQAQRVSASLCDATKLQATAWDDCLRKAQGDSDKAVEDAVAKFKAAVDTHTDLSAAQRALLKRQIGESNDLWTRYRNHLCQNVLPILAGPRAKIYEENLGCIIDLNVARQKELDAMMAPR